MNEPYTKIVSRLPPWAAEVLPSHGDEVQEIRLTVGAPVSGLEKGRTKIWGNHLLTEKEIRESLYLLCNHALPAYEGQLAEGYFTVNGCRVGVSGQLRYEEGQVRGYGRIQSLNIRIPCSFSVSLPREVIEYIEEPDLGGILVAGPPGSGKTTLLGALGRYLAEKNKRTVVVDEKQELNWLIELNAPFLMGFSQCRRADGILYGLRGCNPEFILCDEIATEEDVAAVTLGIGAGVRFLATVHALGISQLEKRFCYRALQPGCFGMLVLLGRYPGETVQVIRV